MVIVSAKTLALFRTIGCAWCGQNKRTQAAHWLARGMAAGRQLDVKINLIGLCPACHHAAHNGGEPTSEDLLAIIAQREGQLQDDIRAVINMLRRMPPRPLNFNWDLALGNLNAAARELALRTLAEAGIKTEAA